jgi:DNA-binding LacI/PurR family transcriptional regulator
MTRRKAPATYTDIQRITGLSLATISKYYNGGNVLEANREAIKAASDSLGYRLNRNASGLRRGATQTVGVLLPSLLSHFHLSIIAGAEQYLRSHGYSVLLASDEGGPLGRSRDALELLLGRQVDGIITMPSHSDVPALTDVIESGIPVVAIDLWQPGLNADFICLDNTGAGWMAGQHLVDHGHESVGVIVGDFAISTTKERYEGFAAALPGGIAPELVLAGPLTSEWGHEAMNKILSQRPRPTAVFAANYDLTLGAVIAINESGLRLGQDISLIGFDGDELARVTRPTLTILIQPVADLAREAARTMHERLEGDRSALSEPTMKRLSASLVAGGSVATLRT